MPGERGEPHRPRRGAAGRRATLPDDRPSARGGCLAYKAVVQSFNLLPASGFQLNQALRNEPLQAPQVGVPDAKTFKVVNRLHEVFGTRSPVADCLVQHGRDLLVGQPGRKVAPLAIGGKSNGAHGGLPRFRGNPSWRTGRRLDGHFPSPQLAQIREDPVPSNPI